MLVDGQPLRLVAAARRSTSRATWRCTRASAPTRTSCSRSAATTRASSRRAACPRRSPTSSACAPRSTISEDVWFALEAYVAVTSNTLQFGAQASLEASAKFLGVTYTARGEVGLRRAARVLAVRVRRRLRGVGDDHGGHGRPRAARRLARRAPRGAEALVRDRLSAASTSSASTSASRSRSAAPPPPRRRRARTCSSSSPTALGEPPAWRAASRRRGATRAGRADDRRRTTRCGCAPDAELEAVQTVAPLDRELDLYGAYAIDGPRTLDVTGGRHRRRRRALTWTPVRTGSRPRSTTT